MSWYEHLGKAGYRNVKTLTVTAGSGGSDNPTTRLWRCGLQRLADSIKLAIRVCHCPPGTTRWLHGLASEVGLVD